MLHNCDEHLNKVKDKLDSRGGSINQKLNFGKKKQNMTIIDEESSDITTSQYNS